MTTYERAERAAIALAKHFKKTYYLVADKTGFEYVDSLDFDKYYPNAEVVASVDRKGVVTGELI
jgi:hypothetical protein